MWWYPHSVNKETVSLKSLVADCKGSTLSQMSWSQIPSGSFPLFSIPQVIQAARCLTTRPVILIKLSIVSLMKIFTLEVLRIWEKALRKELGEFPGSWLTLRKQATPVKGEISEGLGSPFLSGLCFYYLEGLLTSLFVEIDWLNNWASSGKLDCLGAMFSLSPWKVTLIELGCGVKASEMHWTSAFSVSAQFSLWLNFMETNIQGRSSV